MIAAVRQSGLCHRCVNSEQCTFVRDPRYPIRSCDEFCAPAPTPRAASRPQPSPCATETIAAQQENKDLKGLCVNCENRATCTFQKPQSGVWRCEEYR